MKHIQLLRQSKVCVSTRVAHATMLVSEDIDAVSGLMRLQVAKSICRQDNAPCMQCSDCKLVLQDRHSDVVIIDKDKVVVSDVQVILDSILIAPFGNCKVYMVANFDTATKQAQNKLLKSIEEPPAQVVFVLGASNRVDVLPTILSRCQVVDVLPWGYQELRQSMIGIYPDDDNLQFALGMSQGSLTRAVQLCNPRCRDNFILAVQLLLTLKSSVDIARASRLLIDNKEYLKDIVNFVTVIVRDVVVFKHNIPELLLSSAYTRDLLDISQRYTTTALSSILRHIKTTMYRLHTYGNTSSIVDQFLFMLLEQRYNNRAAL
ncbi:MAG: hypothetical protein LBK70_03760 [Clostridiales bacterium]|nr:hypothetical protein [Clostridiales bacterium]